MTLVITLANSFRWSAFAVPVDVDEELASSLALMSDDGYRLPGELPPGPRSSHGEQPMKDKVAPRVQAKSSPEGGAFKIPEHYVSMCGHRSLAFATIARQGVGHPRSTPL
jgi:hypothetical protein